MKILPAVLGLLLVLPATAMQSHADAALEAALAGDHRAAGNRARDRYRNPAETLTFFGWQPDMTVVELWPGGGWYTEILAPITRERGKLFAAAFALSDPDAPDYRARIQQRYLQKLTGAPQVYDHVVVTELGTPGRATVAPPGSADLVLTFRNVHNWMEANEADIVFDAAYRALRPGGIFGVVEHRAPEGTDRATMIDSGYVTEAHVIRLAEAAGFELVARSAINANPDDDADHPEGVWTLPPSLRHCGKLAESERADCQARYRAIGESDRMTLRFRKPG